MSSFSSFMQGQKAIQYFPKSTWNGTRWYQYHWNDILHLFKKHSTKLGDITYQINLKETCLGHYGLLQASSTSSSSAAVRTHGPWAAMGFLPYFGWFWNPARNRLNSGHYGLGLVHQIMVHWWFRVGFNYFRLCRDILPYTNFGHPMQSMADLGYSKLAGHINVWY